MIRGWEALGKRRPDEAVQGAGVAIACVDPALASAVYRMNAACLRRDVPFITGAMHGTQAVLGPTVRPGVTACYHCYRVRAAAADPHPGDARAVETFRHNAFVDRSAVRENIPFAAGLLGHQLGWEA